MFKIPLKKAAAVATLAVFAAVILVFSGVYTDYIELLEIGENFTDAFWQNLKVSTVTFLLSFTVFFVVIFINFYFARKNLMHMNLSFLYLRKNMPFIMISAGFAAILALVFRERIANSFLPFLTSEWFDMSDPIFGKDVGYYVFQRPFYIAFIEALLAFSIFLMAITALTYFSLYARYDFYEVKKLLREKGILAHQITTIIIYFLIKAFSYKYQAESILYDANNSFVGGNYIDIKIWIPFYGILPVLLLVIVGLVVYFTLKVKIIPAFFSVSLYPIAMLAVTLVAQITQTVVVEPDEFAIESVYMQHNIDFTRAAYGIGQVQEHDFYVENNLTGADIMKNLDTINNIRLIDYNQTIKAANQIQSVRNYYQFYGADVVPYEIGGELTAVSLSAREITTDRIEESAKNYINTKMKYTHGSGVVMNPVNRITEQGQPYFIIRDIPPRSLDGAPEVTQPRIYYGENMSSYVVVNTKDREIDDIAGGGYDYTGSSGIQLSWLSRIVYAAKLGDVKLLVSDQIDSKSKLLANRSVLSRVHMAAPFLNFDPDIYILIDGVGRLKWIVDGYTTSQWFPYAQYSGDINYIRNSVKAVVDAYDGTVKLYIVDESDPIVRSYRRIYPTLFEQTPFPKDLEKHLRYPKGIFKIQAEIMKRYHVGSAADFYGKQGVWTEPKEKYEGDKPVITEPYYNVIKLKGEDRAEFVLMQPYTYASKNNLVATLVARCRPGHYGNLVVYNFIQDEDIPGPFDIENRIDSDSSLSQEIAQWKSEKATVIRGNIITVPIKNSILYIEPIYTLSGGDYGEAAKVRRVVVAYGDKMVARPTLDEAIGALFGVSMPAVATTNEETLAEVAQRAVKSFEEIKAHSQNSDWESYGKAMQELEYNINALREKIVEEQEENDEILLTE